MQNLLASQVQSVLVERRPLEDVGLETAIEVLQDLPGEGLLKQKPE